MSKICAEKLILPSNAPMRVGGQYWFFFCWKLHEMLRTVQKKLMFAKPHTHGDGADAQTFFYFYLSIYLFLLEIAWKFPDLNGKFITHSWKGAAGPNTLKFVLLEIVRSDQIRTENTSLPTAIPPQRPLDSFAKFLKPLMGFKKLPLSSTRRFQLVPNLSTSIL